MNGISQRSSRRHAVERRELITVDGEHLEVAHFHTDESTERGIVLIPSLIGGSFILFGRQFRVLVKAGYRIVSFNYRGHAPSDGLFTMRSSFDDTFAIALQLRRENPGVPIHAVGACSGSMPIFHILERVPDFFSKLAFINAIHHIQQTASPLRAVRMYLQARGLQWPSSLGDAVSTVLDSVFPEIDKGPEYFGILPYRNVDRSVVIREYLTRSQPTISGLPTPTLCCYGQDDAMLGLADKKAEDQYRTEFQARFPNIEFQTFRADHFMTGLKEEVAGNIRAFLDA